MDKSLKAISKFLSYILRHHPEAIDITLDSEGWVEIDTLLQQAAAHGRIISHAQLLQVVAENSKKRFTVSPCGTRIRAAQGHSTAQVSLQHTPAEPPEWLYHGTAQDFLAPIREQGLLAGSRHHVHLSPDAETARQVGQRHGKVVVLKVRAQAMHAAGLPFYISDNGVWLTEHVPPSFLQFPPESTD